MQQHAAPAALCSALPGSSAGNGGTDSEVPQAATIGRHSLQQHRLPRLQRQRPAALPGPVRGVRELPGAHVGQLAGDQAAGGGLQGGGGAGGSGFRAAVIEVAGWQRRKGGLLSGDGAKHLHTCSGRP
jgi:hypothetical protein